MPTQSQSLVDQLRSVRGSIKSREYASCVNRALVLIDGIVKLLASPNSDTATIEKIKEKFESEGLWTNQTAESFEVRQPGAFRVSWEIDADGALDPRGAAQEIASTYFKPNIAGGEQGSACIFRVTGADAITVIVDLSEAQPD